MRNFLAILFICSSSVFLFGQELDSNPVYQNLSRMTEEIADSLIDEDHIFLLHHSHLIYDKELVLYHRIRDSLAPKYGFKYLRIGACSATVHDTVKSGYSIYNSKVLNHLNKNQANWKNKLDKKTTKVFKSENEKRIASEQRFYSSKTCTYSFEEVTKFELYDSFGNSVLKGESISVDLSQFKEGIYYLSFKGRSVKLYKRKCKV